MADYDLCIIGGGINGAGIARDAAGRGLSVLLVEAKDLACATSSSSTKLVHGGLRYLEHYEFGLVRESLKERDALLKAAPHIVRPMDFVLPHDDSLRPAWMIRLGLFLYDRLAGWKSLKPSGRIDCTEHVYGSPLIHGQYKTAFSYTDCWVDDARLVVLNALDAKERGADILPRTECTGLQAEPDQTVWTVSLRDVVSGDNFKVTARAVVNAAGPWVRRLLDEWDLSDDAPRMRLVKGSHIIVPKMFEGDHAYILQQPDKRIVFAIPYEKNYTLVGTTEQEFTGDLYNVQTDHAELEYLVRAVNRFFQHNIRTKDILWIYSGVRPLLDDGDGNASTVTRDYKLHLETQYGPPILSVFGGKITTYRKLAEKAVDRLMGKRAGWTLGVPLPGGGLPDGDFETFVKRQREKYGAFGFPQELVDRYARAYGTRMDVFLKDATRPGDLGRHFGDGVYEAEIVYLLACEFAWDIGDILSRRSKLGLHIGQNTVRALEEALPSLKEALKDHV